MKTIHSMKIFVLLVACYCYAGSVYAGPKFPPPPDATIGRPGNAMVINGVAMDIRQFTSNRSVDAVLQFYREFWPAGTEDKPGYTETDILEPWQIITRVEDGYLMTVQVTENGDSGSTGLLAISKLPDPENMPTLGKGFPKMHGSFVLNDIVSKDIGKKGRTLQISNSYSVEHNANFYRNHYEDSGWGVDIDQSVSGGDTQSLRFSAGSKNVTIVIHKTGKGSVIIAQLEN